MNTHESVARQCNNDRVARPHGNDHFTEAESRVLDGLLCGWTVKQIAHACGVSEATTRSQVRALLEKSGCRRQTDLLLHHLRCHHCGAKHLEESVKGP